MGFYKYGPFRYAHGNSAKEEPLGLASDCRGHSVDHWRLCAQRDRVDHERESAVAVAGSVDRRDCDAREMVSSSMFSR